MISACRKSINSSYRKQVSAQSPCTLKAGQASSLCHAHYFAMLIYLQKAEKPELKIPAAYSFPKGKMSILTFVEWNTVQDATFVL